MRRRLCGKLHGGLSHLLFARPARHQLITSYIADDRDLCLPHLHSTPLLGGPRRNVATTFGVEKLEWCGYAMVKKILKIVLFIFTEFTNVTDIHTHTA